MDVPGSSKTLLKAEKEMIESGIEDLYHFQYAPMSVLAWADDFMTNLYTPNATPPSPPASTEPLQPKKKRVQIYDDAQVSFVSKPKEEEEIIEASSSFREEPSTLRNSMRLPKTTHTIEKRTSMFAPLPNRDPITIRKHSSSRQSFVRENSLLESNDAESLDAKETIPGTSSENHKEVNEERELNHDANGKHEDHRFSPLKAKHTTHQYEKRENPRVQSSTVRNSFGSRHVSHGHIRKPQRLESVTIGSVPRLPRYASPTHTSDRKRKIHLVSPLHAKETKATNVLSAYKGPPPKMHKLSEPVMKLQPEPSQLPVPRIKSRGSPVTLAGSPRRARESPIILKGSPTRALSLNKTLDPSSAPARSLTQRSLKRISQADQDALREEVNKRKSGLKLRRPLANSKPIQLRSEDRQKITLTKAILEEPVNILQDFSPPEKEAEETLPNIGSDMDDSVIQEWARSPELKRAMWKQNNEVDPEQVFGPIPSLHLEDIFQSSRLKNMKRTSMSK